MRLPPHSLVVLLGGASAGGSITLAAELWVSASGSDSTGTRGNPSLPFLTIGAAIAAASAGDTIHIGAGTYAEQVNVSKSRLTLRGAGVYSAVISYSGTQIGITLASAVTDTVIENIEIDGQRTTSTETSGYGSTSGCAILLAAGNHRTRISRVKITNPGGHAIYSNNSTTTDDVTVSECYLASVATSSSTLVAKEVRYGILNFGGVNHTYSGNYITGFCQAIGLWYGAANCRVTSNRAINNFGKIGAGGTGSRSAFEDFGATATTHGNNLWSDNYVAGTTSKCFEIATGTLGSTYSNNVCTFVSSALTTGGYTAFEVTSSAGEPTNRITIIGNTINGLGLTNSTGMQVNGALAGVSVTGNTFYQCATYGVFIGGTATAGGMTVDGNTFHSCGEALRLNNNGDGFTISNNAFINGTSTQMYIDSGAGHSIVGNAITGASATAIDVTSSASRTVVSSNTIISSSGTARGIYIRSSNNSITGNTVRLTGRAGQDSTLVINAGNRNIIQGNTLSNTVAGTHAVFMTGACSGNVVRNNVLESGTGGEEIPWWTFTGANVVAPNITSAGCNEPFYRSWTFDPKVVCDGAVDRLFLMTVLGDNFDRSGQARNGFVATAWKLSFEADPTTEADLDLKRADAFIGVANSAVMDVLDTTAGVAGELIFSSINSGNTVAYGKVMYLEFGTPYTETGHQCVFELWGYYL